MFLWWWYKLAAFLPITCITINVIYSLHGTKSIPCSRRELYLEVLTYCGSLTRETDSVWFLVSAVAIETQHQKGSGVHSPVPTRNLSIQSCSSNPILKWFHLMKSISSRDGWTDYRDNCNVTFSGFSLFSTQILFPLFFLFFLFYLFFFFQLGSLVLPPCFGFLYVEQIGNAYLKSSEGLIERMCALGEYNLHDIFAA